MTISYDQEIQEIWIAKEKALKHLAELSQLSNQKPPQLDVLNVEQKQWVKDKMKGRMNK